jgi:hypothetical protein
MESRKAKCEFCGRDADGRMVFQAFDKSAGTVIGRNHWLCLPCGEQTKYAREVCGTIQAERGQK